MLPMAVRPAAIDPVSRGPDGPHQTPVEGLAAPGAQPADPGLDPLDPRTDDNVPGGLEKQDGGLHALLSARQGFGQRDFVGPNGDLPTGARHPASYQVHGPGQDAVLHRCLRAARGWTGARPHPRRRIEEAIAPARLQPSHPEIDVPIVVRKAAVTVT